LYGILFSYTTKYSTFVGFYYPLISLHWTSLVQQPCAAWALKEEKKNNKIVDQQWRIFFPA